MGSNTKHLEECNKLRYNTKDAHMKWSQVCWQEEEEDVMGVHFWNQECMGKIIIPQCLPKEGNKAVFHFHHKWPKTYLWCLCYEVIFLIRIINVIST